MNVPRLLAQYDAGGGPWSAYGAGSVRTGDVPRGHRTAVGMDSTDPMAPTIIALYGEGALSSFGSSHPTTSDGFLGLGVGPDAGPPVLPNVKDVGKTFYLAGKGYVDPNTYYDAFETLSNPATYLDASALVLNAAKKYGPTVLHYAAVVASFVPALQPAAVGMELASHLAAGERIDDAFLNTVQSLVPGGDPAKYAFQIAHNVYDGQNVIDATYNAVPGGTEFLKYAQQYAEGRNSVPPEGRPAFDVAVALIQARQLQDKAIKTAWIVIDAASGRARAEEFRDAVNNKGVPIVNAALFYGGAAAQTAAQRVLRPPTPAELAYDAQQKIDAAKKKTKGPAMLNWNAIANAAPVIHSAARGDSNAKNFLTNMANAALAGDPAAKNDLAHVMATLRMLKPGETLWKRLDRQYKRGRPQVVGTGYPYGAVATAGEYVTPTNPLTPEQQFALLLQDG